MNKKLYIYKLIFSSFFIFILFDLNGCIKNIEAGLYAFLCIFLIIHGLITLHIYQFLKEKFCMLGNILKKIFAIVKNIFNKKNKKKGAKNKKSNKIEATIINKKKPQLKNMKINKKK